MTSCCFNAARYARALSSSGCPLGPGKLAGTFVLGFGSVAGSSDVPPGVNGVVSSDVEPCDALVEGAAEYSDVVVTGLLVIGALAVESSAQADTDPSARARPVTASTSRTHFVVIATSCRTFRVEINAPPDGLVRRHSRPAYGRSQRRGTLHRTPRQATVRARPFRPPHQHHLR